MSQSLALGHVSSSGGSDYVFGGPGEAARLIAIPGGFTRAGVAGANSFRFTGRIAGHKLAPGRYLLKAMPAAGGQTGQPKRASFRVIT